MAYVLLEINKQQRQQRQQQPQNTAQNAIITPPLPQGQNTAQQNYIIEEPQEITKNKHWLIIAIAFLAGCMIGKQIGGK